MTKHTFYNERVRKQLRITPEENEIELSYYDEESGFEKKAINEILSEDSDGNIRILVYSLDGKLIQYDNPAATLDKPNIANNRGKYFYITRLREPKVKKDKNLNESVQKYDIPSGVGTYPFFSKSLVDKFRNKEKIDTLILTEGYLKAIAGCKHGLDVVGLSSITHYRQKDTETMYVDVLRLIDECCVRNVVVLWDGDCKDISKKAIAEKTDLSKRPEGFINAAKAVRELLRDVRVDVYFAHIKSSEFVDQAKGLDDAIISLQDTDELNVFLNELKSVTGKKNYVYRENISSDAKKLYDYFCLKNSTQFYLKHQSLIGNNNFIFKGTEFYYNEQKGKCHIIKPKEADDYIRVGNDYYEFIDIPDKYGNPQKIYVPRKKETIKDDHGKDIFDYIQKYKAFINFPDHENYQREIFNNFNQYHELTYTPEEGTCESSHLFMKHIFGEQLEIGYDYVQLLYQNPRQILPILCLVSKENKTGKSTFIKWLKQMFGQNATIVSNSDFSSEFNYHWASKLLICCEESFLDKKAVVEKIKQLSTANNINMNRKGKDAGEIAFYGKFILASNNESNFIIANSDDVRYWVRKVPVITLEDPLFEQKLIEEIPQFLNFLSKREMLYKKSVTRMWFPEQALITEAFKKLVENNMPTVLKELRSYIRNMFLEFGCFDSYNGTPCLMLTLKFIHMNIFNKRYEYNYLETVLKDYRNMLKYEKYEVKGVAVTKRFKIPSWDTSEKSAFSTEETAPTIKFETHVGKPWVFFANNFLNSNEFTSISTYESEECVF